MLGAILVVVLTLALLNVLRRWSHSHEWGHAPMGGLGIAFLLVVILMFVGHI